MVLPISGEQSFVSPTVCATSILVVGSVTVAVTGHITEMGFARTVGLSSLSMHTIVTDEILCLKNVGTQIFSAKMNSLKSFILWAV